MRLFNNKHRGMSLGKAAVVTPLYVSVAWTLMVSYQLLTQTAVTTVTTYVDTFWPSVGAWLVSRMDMLVFIHAFAWVFLLSSAIPAVILGKGRGVLVQFFVCLTLTFSAFIVQDIITTYENRSIGQIFNLAVLFHNPFLALGYLSLPYLLMVGFDINSRRKQKKKEKIESVTDVYLNDAAEADENGQQEEWVETDENAQEEEWVEEEENAQQEYSLQ
jgi:hypothetical protein